MKKLFILILISSLIFACSKEDKNDTQTQKLGCTSYAELMPENDFNAVETNNYSISEVKLNDDCLKITISSSGCDSENWEMKLYSTNNFYAVFPLQRFVKIKLINDELCKALLQKTVSFDLTPFQVEGQNEIPLNIEGWNEQIIYTY